MLAFACIPLALPEFLCGQSQEVTVVNVPAKLRPN